ncbi:MAG: RNA-binding S4 domain-containing protein [Alphaproteobacteria bacterium]|nr:RNA-binding S4 domain-containing protein [Alphaproteobacteria bacterium]
MNQESIRLDKWLWQARFCKTRALAAKTVERGGIRRNGESTRKPHAQLRVGDVLTLAIGREVRVVKVLALGQRRGPASEARGLYDLLGHDRPVLSPMVQDRS